MIVRKIIQGLNKSLFYLATLPLAIMMVTTVIDVIGRYFRHPLPGTVEINELMLALVCAWCWAHVQAKKGHISIDLLVNKMSRRGRDIANLLMSLVALTIIGLIAWRAIPSTLFAFRVKEWTDLLSIPTWPFRAMLFLGALCLSLQLVLDIVDYSRGLVRQPPAGPGTVTPQVSGGTGID